MTDGIQSHERKSYQEKDEKVNPSGSKVRVWGRRRQWRTRREARGRDRGDGDGWMRGTAMVNCVTQKTHKIKK